MRRKQEAVLCFASSDEVLPKIPIPTSPVTSSAVTALWCP